MIKYCLVAFAIVLAGCGSTPVPVTAKFPEIPSKLLEKCPRLQSLDEKAKLSDVAKTVTQNYTTYYECAVKHDGIVEWYEVQRRIYNNIK